MINNEDDLFFPFPLVYRRGKLWWSSVKNQIYYAKTPREGYRLIALRDKLEKPAEEGSSDRVLARDVPFETL